MEILNNIKKLIVFLCGIPASGKSTYAHYIQDGYTKEIVSIIGRDLIRKEFDYKISEEDINLHFNEKLYNALKDKKIKIILIDNTNVRQKYIKEIIATCLSYENESEFAIKIFDTPYEECLKRNDLRIGMEKVPIDAMERMKNNFNKFIANSKNFFEENNIKVLP